jgi:hypothetical protein
VAWVEYLAALRSDDATAAEAHRARAAELSSPAGVYPGLLVRRAE